MSWREPVLFERLVALTSCGLVLGCGASISDDLGEVPAEVDAGADSQQPTTEPAPDAPPVFCDEESFAIERRPVDIMIALDMSGSMFGNKYATARTAISNVVTQFAGDVNFGFDTYPHEFSAHLTNYFSNTLTIW